MIQSLLQHEIRDRIRAVTDCDVETLLATKSYHELTYEKLRRHPFFTSNWHLTTPYYRSLRPSGEVELNHDSPIPLEVSNNLYQTTPPVIPSLHDLCLRAVGEAVIQVAFATADNGGIRPEQFPWMQQFSLQKLSLLDQERIKYYLYRQEKLHIPSIYRLFHRNLPDSRCLRTIPSWNTREYIGLNRELQGHYKADYHFTIVSNLAMGRYDSDSEGKGKEENFVKATITQINKLRPKVLLVMGPFTTLPITTTTTLEEVVVVVNQAYEQQIQTFRKLMARVSDTIPVLFIPSEREMHFQLNNLHNSHHIQVYQSYFGCDYYGFWYQGTRGIIINSSLLIYGMNPLYHLLTEANAQEEWLEEEDL